MSIKRSRVYSVYNGKRSDAERTQWVSSFNVPTPLYPALQFSDINASTMFHSHTIALNNYSSDFLHSLSVTVVVYHYYHRVCVCYWLGNLIPGGGSSKGALLKLPKSLCMSYVNPVCLYVYIYMTAIPPLRVV